MKMQSVTAKVAAVTAAGVKLLFPGETTPGEKVYRVNTGAVFSVGDVVCIRRAGGTVLVEYPIGKPGAGLDSAPTAGSKKPVESGAVYTALSSVESSIKGKLAPKRVNVAAGANSGYFTIDSGMHLVVVRHGNSCNVWAVNAFTSKTEGNALHTNNDAVTLGYSATNNTIRISNTASSGTAYCLVL